MSMIERTLSKKHDLLKRNRDWDKIEPGDLLPLTGVRTTTGEFGYLLRPYWIPATVLDYEVERTCFGHEGETRKTGLKTSLEMLRCNADGCIWRERNSRKNETIRVYDRTRQALYRYDATGEEIVFARNRAFSELSILSPLMPIAAKVSHEEFFL